jgi:hypothetical protein
MLKMMGKKEDADIPGEEGGVGSGSGQVRMGVGAEVYKKN